MLNFLDFRGGGGGGGVFTGSHGEWESWESRG